MIMVNRKSGTFVNHYFPPSLSVSLSLALQPHCPFISCPSTHSIPKKPISDSTLVPSNPRKSGCRIINVEETRQTLVDDLSDPSMKMMMVVTKDHGYFMGLVVEAKIFEGVISSLKKLITRDTVL